MFSFSESMADFSHGGKEKLIHGYPSWTFFPDSETVWGMTNLLDENDQLRVLTLMNDTLIRLKDINLSTDEKRTRAGETIKLAINELEPVVKEMYARKMPIA